MHRYVARLLPGVPWVVLTLVVATLHPFHIPARGQTHFGTIRGTVSDRLGAVIENARYRVVSEDTGRERGGTTGRDGRYGVTQLQPGPYRVEIEAPGHTRSVHRVVLAIDQQYRLDVSLEPGALAESIVVTAAGSSLARDAIGLSTILDNRLVQALPLDGRNFLELALLAPGTAPAADGAAASLRGDFAFSVSGARDDANSFLLDGGYNVDSKLNTPAIRPPADAIAEFEVLTNGGDASFGRSAGGQINVITKSGTNQLTGTAYGFVRTREMNGRNHFAPADEPKPEYSRTQAGFSLGGPIARDTAFFFVDYEATRRSEGITRVTNVPTSAERQGDFSNSLLPRPVDPFTRLPFPGDTIPTVFLNSVGLALADLYPLPNRDIPFRNFVSSPTLDESVDHFDVKIDHHPAQSSRLTGRYSFGDRRLFEPFSGPNFSLIPGYGVDAPRRAQNLLLAETHVFSPRLVNDMRLVVNRVSSRVLPEARDHSLNHQVGLPELFDDPRDQGLSLTTVTGLSPLGDEFNNPQETDLSTFQLRDTLTWARRQHLVTAGFDIRFTRQNGFRDVQSRGFLAFSDVGFSGSALADLLLGLPVTTGGAILDNPQQLRTASYTVFVNDSFQITPRLTLSGGLRYELNTPPVDADDRANVFNVEIGTLVPVGSAGVPRGGYELDSNNFAPRIGAAWSLGERARTVIRASYGVFYDHSALAPGEGLYFNQPFFDFRLYFPAPRLGSFLSIDDPFPADSDLPQTPSALTFQRDLTTPYFHEWNVGLQHEVGTGRSVSVTYVGSRGHDLIRGRDINQAEPSPTVPNLRPNPAFADVIAIESEGRSVYDSLQLRYQERMSAGTIVASYTVADSKDDASGFFSSTGDPNFPQDSNNPQAEFGPSGFNVRQRLTVGFAYGLPLGPGHRFLASGWPAAIFGQWQAAGVVSARSGRPFTVALLPAVDQSNTGRAALGFGANDRPHLVGDPNLANPSEEAWFNADAFETPAFGSFGNSGRNVLEGPGFVNVNLALVRLVSVGPAARGATLELRAEAFNVLNRVNLGLPDAFLGSPTFGQILSASEARRLQLGVRVLF